MGASAHGRRAAAARRMGGVRILVLWTAAAASRPRRTRAGRARRPTKLARVRRRAATSTLHRVESAGDAARRASGTGAWSCACADAPTRRAPAACRGVPRRPAAARHAAGRARAPGGRADGARDRHLRRRAGRHRQREGPPDQDRAGGRRGGRRDADDRPGGGDRRDRLQHARAARRDDADRPADRDDRRLHLPRDPRRPARAAAARCSSCSRSPGRPRC